MKKGILFAILAAVMYALNAPLSKIMLDYLPPTLTAGFLYIGAGVSMCFVFVWRTIKKPLNKESNLTVKELPYTVAMVLLDIAAPVCLMFGLKYSSAANASLLNNFEVVITAVVALIFFKEAISPRLWTGIVFVTLACGLLSFEGKGSFQFSYGSLLILLACLCWGVENNCTRKISVKDPLQIVLLKGVFSGSGAIIIGLICGEKITHLWAVFAVIGIGFVAYGLSIFFYVHAQRIVGAARTSAYYAIAPFVGTALSLIIFKGIPNWFYFGGLALMIIGAVLCAGDKPLFKRKKA